MKRIPLSNGGSAIVDDRHAARVSAAGPWHMTRSGVRNSRGQLLHRFLRSGKYVRHKNGCKTDCRSCNLQSCTLSQAVRSQKASQRNTSGVLGVSYDSDRQRWVAQMNINGERVLFRRFTHLHQAADAREAAEIIYHGEYRRRNERCPNKNCPRCK